jgi:hypothetical protein
MMWQKKPARPSPYLATVLGSSEEPLRKKQKLDQLEQCPISPTLTSRPTEESSRNEASRFSASPAADASDGEDKTEVASTPSSPTEDDQTATEATKHGSHSRPIAQAAISDHERELSPRRQPKTSLDQSTPEDPSGDDGWETASQAPSLAAEISDAESTTNHVHTPYGNSSTSGTDEETKEASEGSTSGTTSYATEHLLQDLQCIEGHRTSKSDDATCLELQCLLRDGTREWLPELHVQKAANAAVATYWANLPEGDKRPTTTPVLFKIHGRQNTKDLVLQVVGSPFFALKLQTSLEDLRKSLGVATASSRGQS